MVTINPAEAAVPQNTIHRLEAMMEMLDRHQQEGRGPEARWALGCFLRRVDEGVQALDSIIRILARRLVPRGYMPVRRVPSSETLRWQVFSWARGYRDCFEFVIGRHMQTGLMPDDNEIPTEAPRLSSPSPRSVVASEAQASTPREAVSITEAASSPPAASSGDSVEDQVSGESLDSEWVKDESGTGCTLRLPLLPRNHADHLHLLLSMCPWSAKKVMHQQI